LGKGKERRCGCGMAMGYGKLLEIGKPEAGEVKTKK
jgi:hypothetical protein